MNATNSSRVTNRMMSHLRQTSPEAQQLSPVYQSLPEFDNENQDGEPLRQKAQNLDFSSPSDMNSLRIITIEI